MRKLNGFYAIEVLNGRLNGSSDKLERNTFGFKNATFTKKVAGRSKISSLIFVLIILNIKWTIA